MTDAFSSMVSNFSEEDPRASEFLESLDPRIYVGSRHHTVPRFLLERWSTNDQVQVYSRVDDAFSVRNIRDLAVKDFNTFVDCAGEMDSSFESLLGAIEAPAAAVISRLLSPFTRTVDLTADEIAKLVVMVSFQAVRTTRARRVLELQTEWLMKTLAQGRVPDEELREISVVPHQNDLLRTSMTLAHELLPLIACRPMALVFLDTPSLLLGDEPLLVNDGTDDVEHHADCFLSEIEIKRRIAKEGRKKKRLRRDVSRVLHTRSTTPRGLGVALELVLPVSPRAALWWGPIQDAPFGGPIEVDRLEREDSERFAGMVNEGTSVQALDWIVSTLHDEAFGSRSFPPLGPLITVCDGGNAAAVALNDLPTRFRPHRLTRPERHV